MSKKNRQPDVPPIGPAYRQIRAWVRLHESLESGEMMRRRLAGLVSKAMATRSQEEYDHLVKTIHGYRAAVTSESAKLWIALGELLSIREGGNRGQATP